MSTMDAESAEKEYMLSEMRKVVQRVKEQLISLGYEEYRYKTFDVSFMYRKMRALGTCKKLDIYGEHCELMFNYYYIKSATDESAINVIAHEVCHAYSKAYGHDKAWKCIAAKLCRAYGYKITTRADEEESLKWQEEKQRLGMYKYEVRCLTCNHVWKYHRMGQVIKGIYEHPETMKCPYCNKNKWSVEKL